jgi:hypothetical protein
MTKHSTSPVRRRQAALVAGVAVAAVTLGATDATASRGTPQAIARTTAMVDRAWEHGNIRERSSVTTRIAGGRATLTDGRGNAIGVSIAGLRRGAAPLRMGRTTMFANGLGKGVDAAVQRTSTGVRMLSVIRSASAPTTYRYPLRLPHGATLQQQSSGVVLIRNAAGRAVGTVRAPWAIDARGTRVSTRFEVRGRTLVQHVEHRGAVYPVIADPSIDFGLTSATITLNAKDQRIILSGGGTAAGGLLGALLCAESGPGAVLCAVGGAVIGTMVFEAIKEYAVRENCELHVKIGYFPPSTQGVSTTCH